MKARIREKNRRKLKTIFVLSATRGGSFWTRIRLGIAVAAPGVRGRDAQEKWTENSLRIQKQRLAPKVRPWEAGFGSELDGAKLWPHQVFVPRMR